MAMDSSRSNDIQTEENEQRPCCPHLDKSRPPVILPLGLRRSLWGGREFVRQSNSWCLDCQDGVAQVKTCKVLLGNKTRETKGLEEKHSSKQRKWTKATAIFRTKCVSRRQEWQDDIVQVEVLLGKLRKFISKGRVLKWPRTENIPAIQALRQNTTNAENDQKYLRWRWENQRTRGREYQDLDISHGNQSSGISQVRKSEYQDLNISSRTSKTWTSMKYIKAMGYLKMGDLLNWTPAKDIKALKLGKSERQN